MKSDLTLVGLLATLLITTASAQTTSDTSDCTKARDPIRCEKRETALRTCSDLRSADKRLCFETHMLPDDCGSAQDPVRCERIQQAKVICGEKLGADQRRCLLEQAGPPVQAKNKAKRSGTTKKKPAKKPPAKKPAKPPVPARASVAAK